MQTRIASTSTRTHLRTYFYTHKRPCIHERGKQKQPPILRNCQQFDEQRLKTTPHTTRPSLVGVLLEVYGKWRKTPKMLQQTTTNF
ncbi:unnamed protein product, partial [Ceratitis capitata]